MDRIARWLTRGAAVVRPVVAIIAALKPGFTWHKVGAHHAITAASHPTITQADVGLHVVPVIAALEARLPRLKITPCDPVAAACQTAIR